MSEEKKLATKADYSAWYVLVAAVFASTSSSIVNDEFFSGQPVWFRIGVAIVITVVCITGTVLILKRIQR